MGIAAFSFSLSNVNLAGMLYSFPMPLIVLILAVLALVIVGILSRIGALLKGKGTAIDYIGIFLILLLLALFGLIMFKTAFRGVTVI